MIPRYQPAQTNSQRPLYNEILALNKLLVTDIQEQAARILDHFVAANESKFEFAQLQTPPQLKDKFLEKCEDFETVCDQIYYTLEQSKRVLQLEYQQRLIQVKAENLEQEKQQMAKVQQQQQQLENDPMNVDLEFENSQMALSMEEPNNMMETDTNTENKEQAKDASAIDEEDMEELLQIQRDRLERLKNVIVFGMDADAVKVGGRNEDKEDLLF